MPLLNYFFFLTSWIQAVSAMWMFSSLFQMLMYKGLYIFLVYSIHEMKRRERKHKDVIVASLGHPHYALWQKGRCKHVIHPCEEIQPFHRPRRQP